MMMGRWNSVSATKLRSLVEVVGPSLNLNIHLLCESEMPYFYFLSTRIYVLHWSIQQFFHTNSAGCERYVLYKAYVLYFF